MSTAPSWAASPAKRGRFSRLWRTIKQLFHEIVAAIFAVLAFAWFNAAIRAWSRDAAHWLIAVAVMVAGSFCFFAITSFRHARRI